MRWLARAIVVVLLLLGSGPGALAGEKKAAELAALIDRHIEARLEAEGLRPAERADEATLLRRIHLDLHGVIPTAEQAARFLDDPDPERWPRLIDALVEDPRYGEYLADLWQGYLISPLADDRLGKGEHFREWLAGRLNTSTWDRIVSELLTATGKIEQNPAVVYLVEGRLPRTVPDLTDLATRYFMGIRLGCAQCHDHPFTKWTQADYWGLAAFFSQIQTPGRPKVVYQVGVQDDPALSLEQLKASAPDGFLSRPPTFLGGEEAPARAGVSSRAALASWLTAPSNHYFARAMVNRTWWRLLGRGFVNPVDDMHPDNPASHPELLDLLARHFVESGYDLKLLTRAILLSRAYQRTSHSTDNGDRQAELFGRATPRVLSAGQMYDSLVRILGTPTRGKGAGARATSRADFIQRFSDEGDPDPTAYRRGIPQMLWQMNSEPLAGRSLAALAQRLARPGRPADEVAREMFLTILSRRPTAAEQQLFGEHLARAGSLPLATQELGWALLLTTEFSLSH